MSEAKRIFEALIENFGNTSRIVSVVGEGHEYFTVDDDEYLVTFVDSDTGDGDGAAIWFVFKISKVDRTEPDFLFRITGTRSSWSDNQYDHELEVVYGKPVQVTQYYAAS